MNDHQVPRYETGTMHQKFQSPQKQMERKISEQLKEYSFARSSKYQMYVGHCLHLYSGINRSNQQKQEQSLPLALTRVSWRCILFFRCPKYRSVKTLE